MQPQQGYLRKLTRIGLALIAVIALTLSASASAVVDANAATAAPKYRVLIVTAGTRRTARDRGRRQGDQGDRQGHRHRWEVLDLRRRATQIRSTTSSPRRTSRRYRAVVFLGTAATALLSDAQKAAFESYFHNGGGFLGIGSAIETEPGWQFYTDILGTRASGQDGGPVGDDQGRRPRPRRDEEPARVLEPDRRLVQLRGERPRRLARPRHGRRGSVRPAAAGPGARRNRRRHDGRRPSGRLVQGLQGRPLLLHRRWQHRGQLRRRPPSEAISKARSTGRPAWPTRSTATAARPCSRTTSRPRSARRRT